MERIVDITMITAIVNPGKLDSAKATSRWENHLYSIAPNILHENRLNRLSGLPVCS